MLQYTFKINVTQRNAIICIYDQWNALLHAIVPTTEWTTSLKCETNYSKIGTHKFLKEVKIFKSIFLLNTSLPMLLHKIEIE